MKMVHAPLIVLSVWALCYGAPIQDAPLLNIKDVPYMAAWEISPDIQLGGAVIISENYAVTSVGLLDIVSHDDLQLRVGTTELRTGGAIVKVKKLYIHPLFDSTSWDYDIALMELENPFVWDEAVQPIPLADKQPEPGERATMCNWGQTESEYQPQIVVSDNLPLVSLEECRRNYISAGAFISERMICGGLPGFGTCNLDEGGPLVTNNTLIGLYSRGCTLWGYYRVYTNIAQQEIREFIRYYSGI